jgi:DNA modification methylase
MPEFTLHNRDCLDVLREMPDASVGAIITDPPYGIGYASWDSELPPQAVLSECLRVSSGPVLWFGAMSNMLDYADYAPRPERMLVWAPDFSLARSNKSRIFYRFHPIWCWRMPESQSVLTSDVLRHNCEGNHWWDHPATKPEKLMDALCAAFSEEGDTVLDPFAGSGTTGVACMNTGRNFIGIEIDPGYHAIAKRRIEAAAAQLKLFVA